MKKVAFVTGGSRGIGLGRSRVVIVIVGASLVGGEKAIARQGERRRRD